MGRLLMLQQYKFQHEAIIITVSDKVSQEKREDMAGPIIISALAAIGIRVISKTVVPDEVKHITLILKKYTDEIKPSLIITIGGTGLSPRDVTPEATALIMERMVPGMAEVMRAECFNKCGIPYAILSRGLVVIRKKTLIVNLPGSSKGAFENLKVILPVLKHGLDKLRGDTTDCATCLKS